LRCAEKNEHMVFETSMKWHKANWNQWHERTNAQISEWTTKEKIDACLHAGNNLSTNPWLNGFYSCWKIPVLERTLHIARTNSRIYIILKREYKHIPMIRATSKLDRTVVRQSKLKLKWNNAENAKWHLKRISEFTRTEVATFWHSSVLVM
jgi:hypothetical protein